MIATHNSGTGEASGGILSHLVIPFARCQSKTLLQQLNAGARYFDFRIRRHGDKYVFAHGLWYSKQDAESLIWKLAKSAYFLRINIFASFTYEGELDYTHRLGFMNWVKNICDRSLISLDYIAVRKPSWEKIFENKDLTHILEYHFYPINFNSGNYRWLFPVPRFWSLIYNIRHRKVQPSRSQSSHTWIFLDFL